MKFVLLVTIFCVLGTALCVTHEQQKEYAEVLVYTLEDDADAVEELIGNIDATSDKGANAILNHVNSLNFDLHFVVDGMQYLESKNKEESLLLQETISKLNSISNELEKSLQNRTAIVKFRLQRSVKDIVKEAKNLQRIIGESQSHLYRSNVLKFFDDLVTGVNKLFFRALIRAAPVKMLLKTYNQIARRALNLYLSLSNSENINIQNDIILYSSKFSSAISESVNLLKDLTFTYGAYNKKDVKEIIYSLGQICYDNEEVLYNEISFKKVNEQFRNTVVNVSKQLSKMIDAGFSDSGIFVKDENLIHVVFPKMYAEFNVLIRNLENTFENHLTN